MLLFPFSTEPWELMEEVHIPRIECQAIAAVRVDSRGRPWDVRAAQRN